MDTCAGLDIVHGERVEFRVTHSIAKGHSSALCHELEEEARYTRSQDSG